MLDVLVIAVVIAFFAGCFVFIRGSARIIEDGAPAGDPVTVAPAALESSAPASAAPVPAGADRPAAKS